MTYSTLLDGYRCQHCGWTGAFSMAGQIKGEPFCPNPKCDSPFDLEPIRLCTKCRDEKATPDSDYCVGCEPPCERCNGTGIVNITYGGDGYGGRCAGLADAEGPCPDCQLCLGCEERPAEEDRDYCAECAREAGEFRRDQIEETRLLAQGAKP